MVIRHPHVLPLRETFDIGSAAHFPDVLGNRIKHAEIARRVNSELRKRGESYWVHASTLLQRP